MNRKKYLAVLAVVTALSLGFVTGCAQSSGSGASAQTSGTQSEDMSGSEDEEDSGDEETEAAGDTEAAEESSESATDTDSGLVTQASDLDYSDMFTDRDLSGDYDADEAVSVTLSDSGITSDADGDGVEISGDGTLTITEEGVYILTGSLSEGQIVVDADDEDKVQIVLNGVTITNSDSACILVKNADKVFVTLADGTENTLSDTGDDYVQTDSDMTVDAVIFSKADLCFNGKGALTINADYDQAIVSKDDLKFTDGTYYITSTGKGILGKDSLRIHGGTFNVTSGDDALHTSNDEDEGKGYVYIEGGTFTLSSGDDAIHAATALIVEDGTIDVTQSYEGLEGDTIDIDGGEITVTASDDGMNAALPSGDDQEWDMDDGTPRPEAGQTQPGNNHLSGDDMQTQVRGSRGGNMGGMGSMDAQPDAYIHITGGTITVDAGGDGIDSNGTLTIDGGTVTVYGPTSDMNGAIDVGTAAYVNGGTVIASGSAGMAETFDESSEQYSILYYFGETVDAGTEVTLTDESGNVVLSATPTGQYASVVLSSPDLTEGNYTITAGSQSEEISVASVSTTAGSQSAGYGGRW